MPWLFPSSHSTQCLVVTCLTTSLFLTGCLRPASAPCQALPVAQAVFTTAHIQIDGDMEDAWRAARPIGGFVVPGNGAVPMSHTDVRLLWDRNALYVFFQAQDNDIMAYETEADAATFNDDVLEVFLHPDPEAETYCNFEINVLQTVYDAHTQRRGVPMGRRWREWNCTGLRTGARIRGSLNDYSDRDEYWTLELAIPFASLPACNREAPQPGTTWRVLFARYDYSIDFEAGLELSASAPLSRPAFHTTSEYGVLHFLDGSARDIQPTMDVSDP